MTSYFSPKRSISAGIDIGSSKVCCWIVKNDNIIGIGQSASRGFFSGQITDLMALEEDISKALIEAERGAGIRVNDAILTFNSSVFQSRQVEIEISTSDGVVSPSDIAKISASAYSKSKLSYPIHIIPVEYMVDGQRRIKNPVGMIGKNLSGMVHVVTISTTTLKSILSCLKKCQVNVRDIISSGYSSALACLVEDEKELGSTVIDIGAGGTTIASFIEKKLVFLDFVPLGGKHITQDIARGMDSPIDCSERLKILYGAAVPSQNDYKEMLSVQVLGDTNSVSVARSFLINIIQARSDEIFYFARKRIEKIEPLYAFASNRVVITGGASKLPGIKEQASRILEKPVRTARPIHPTLRIGEEFSSIVGIFSYDKLSEGVDSNNRNSFFASISSWLKKKI